MSKVEHEAIDCGFGGWREVGTIEEGGGHVSAFSYMVRQTNNSGLVSISYMVRQAKSRTTLCLGTQDKQTVT